MLTSRRHTIFFPNASPKGVGVACGLPGQFKNAGVQLLREGDEENAKYRPRTSDSVVDPEFARSGVNIGLGTKIVAISIAPDSHIPSCDLWFGGGTDDADRVQVSAGNPWLGFLDVTDTKLAISIPVGIPAIERLTPGNPGYVGSSAWDSSDVVVKNSEGDETHAYGFPLRLEIWYSDLPIETLPRAESRSEMCGHHVVSIAGDLLEEANLYYCTAGRRRIDVHVYTDGDPVNVKIYAVEGMKQADPDGAIDTPVSLELELTEAGATDVDVTDYDVFSFEGNPITALRVQLTAAGELGNAIPAQVKVIAQDY